MKLFGAPRVRIAVVASIIARYDAISMAVRDIVKAFGGASGFDVSVFATRSDFPELRAHEVQHPSALMAHRSYRTADVRIFPFGVFNPLFEAVAAGDGRARQIVQFHNVTPPEYVAPEQRPLIERSLHQLETFRCVDRFWAVSPTNADDLIARGVDRERIEIIPLVVDRPALGQLVHKPAPPVRLLFVGRLVQAKGVLDLTEAADRACALTKVPFRLDIAGNEDFSDPSYAAEAKASVAERGLSTRVRFHGAIEDERLDALYHAAHLLVIPSYHEGFCRPVVEGLRAGCIPVGYAAHNLAHVARGLGRMVPLGDREALAATLVELIEVLAQNVGCSGTSLLPLDATPLSLADFDRAARSYVQEFSFERVAALKLRSVQALLSG